MNTATDKTGVPLAEITAYLDEFLQTTATPDYPAALNGVQLANCGSVRTVAAAVDFSTQTVRAAIAGNADMMIVHHGMFWAGLQPITGERHLRLKELLDADLAIYSSHLPLDRHPQVGNNVLLAKALSLEPSAEFARFQNIFIGVQGTSDLPTGTLLDRAKAFSRTHGGDSIATPNLTANRVSRRWALCTGAGASADTLAEATRDGVDTLIVGEGPHWTAVEAVERDIVIIYVGHYASETLGIYALADDLVKRFDLACLKISAPTGL